MLPVISTVTREAKTARLVNILVVLYKWHRLVTGVANPRERGPHYSKSISKLGLNRILRIFKHFDLDGNGTLQGEEIKCIMAQIGLKLSNESLVVLMSELDENGDGEVSKEEFLQWYADHMVNCSLTTHQRAQFLFELFDKDKNGFISIGEFIDQLDRMSLGFTVDEIGDLVHELDEDGTGRIDPEEFVALLKKYYPEGRSFLF
jgi:Ca2+-binding EF-hand superfamily protein